jgi:hypothetical protein
MFANVHRGARLAALVATGVVTLGGVAAATGTLPGPAQGAAHDAFGAAGIQVPDGGSGATSPDGGAADATTTTTTVDPTTSTSEPTDGDAAPATDLQDARGPDATGPAKHGLCTAYAAGQGSERGKKHGSAAFRALEAAAGGAGQSVDEFCADVTRGGKPQSDATTVTTGATTPTTEAADPGTTPPTQAAPTNAPASGPGNASSHGANANHGASATAHGNPHRG